MVALAYSVLADTHLAEDAAQETFAVACRDLAALKRKEKFAAWLAGICRNVARQMLRTGQRSSGAQSAETAEKVEHKDSRSIAIHRAVWSLRAFDKEPLVLRYYNGLSYAEIAEVLGISQQAVHGRITRAKRKIAKKLKRDGFTGGDYETR